MRLRRWFLPESPDVLGVLSQQAAITVEGLEALCAWATGDAAAARRVRECEHRADERKRALRAGLTAAFTTPLEPEDMFELSRGLDGVMNAAKDTVREAEVMFASPDEAIAEMSACLADGCRELAAAFAQLGGDAGAATAAADRAVHTQRTLERVYRAAMSALIDTGDLRELAARRELYRRLSRTSDGVVDVAERVWYAVLKQT